MEKIIVIVPLLLLVGIFGICANGKMEAGTGNPRYQLKNPATLEMCNSPECISNNFYECKPSQFDTVINGTEIHVEVRGHSVNDECVVYVKIVRVDMSQIPPNYQVIAQGIQGADGICAFTERDIQDIKNQDIDEKYLLSKCEGPLKEIATMLSSK